MFAENWVLANELTNYYFFKNSFLMIILQHLIPTEIEIGKEILTI